MRSAVRLTATERPRVTDPRQVSGLHRALVAAGAGDPSPDEGLSVAYDPATGILRVDADRDVTPALEAWALSPPVARRDQVAATIAGATTLMQLKTALADALATGDFVVVRARSDEE